MAERVVVWGAGSVEIEKVTALLESGAEIGSNFNRGAGGSGEVKVDLQGLRIPVREASKK